MNGTVKLVLASMAVMTFAALLLYRVMPDQIDEESLDLPAGTPIDEIKGFEGPDSAELRRAYKKSFERLSAASYESVSAELDANRTTTRSIIEFAMAHNRGDELELPDEIMIAYEAHLNLLISRLGGLASEVYLDHLGGHGALRLPESSTYLKARLSKHLGESLPAKDDEAGLRRIFLQYGEMVDRFRDGRDRIMGIATGGGGLVFATEKGAGDRGDLFSDALSPQEIETLIGRMSQGVPVITAPSARTSAGTIPESASWTAHLVIAVKTVGGDIYPISIQSYYDPMSRAWWLVHVARQISPRAATAPPPLL